MWNEIVEIKRLDGLHCLISSQSNWTDSEVLAQARLVWGWNVEIIRRILID